MGTFSLDSLNSTPGPAAEILAEADWQFSDSDNFDRYSLESNGSELLITDIESQTLSTGFISTLVGVAPDFGDYF